jgi:hypothetical protein
MRWGDNSRNIEIIGVKLIQPELSPCGVVDEVVRAVIIIDLEEEFDIGGKYDIRLRNEPLDRPRPTANFSHYIGVIYISLSHDSRRRMSVEIELPFRMGMCRPLGRKIWWPVHKMTINFHQSREDQAYVVSLNEMNMPGATTVTPGSTL